MPASRGSALAPGAGQGPSRAGTSPLRQAAQPPEAGGPLSQPRKARWTAPDGTPHTGEVLAPVHARAGTIIPVRVDRPGQPTGASLLPSQVPGLAVLTSIFAVSMLGLVLLAARAPTRWALERRRLAA